MMHDCCKKQYLVWNEGRLTCMNCDAEETSDSKEERIYSPHRSGELDASNDKAAKKTLGTGDCTYCYNKRYYTVLYGIHAAADFERGHDEEPSIHKIACSKCNKNNVMKIKGVKANWWDN